MSSGRVGSKRVGSRWIRAALAVAAALVIGTAGAGAGEPTGAGEIVYDIVRYNGGDVVSVSIVDENAPPPAAPIEAVIDLSEQRMRVSVDGEPYATWKVSTGRRGYATPRGSFRPQHLSPRHRSRLYDGAPMPWSVFFNGHVAVHGTNETGRLGRRASHGCVRLSVKHAKAFYRLVQQAGFDNVSITVQK